MKTLSKLYESYKSRIATIVYKNYEENVDMNNKLFKQKELDDLIKNDKDIIRVDYYEDGKKLNESSMLPSYISAVVGDYSVYNNQYIPYGGGVSTYYYIVNKNGETWHRDGKFRKKTLNDMKHYKFTSVEQAKAQIEKL